jgi:hypothetical protein
LESKRQDQFVRSLFICFRTEGRKKRRYGKKGKKTRDASQTIPLNEEDYFRREVLDVPTTAPLGPDMNTQESKAKSKERLETADQLRQQKEREDDFDIDQIERELQIK